VKLTEQLEVVALTPAKVHGLPVKEPAAVPVLLNATVPAGAEAVPAEEVSLTKAVQLVDWAITIVEGEQVTEVLVVLRLTVTAALEPLLPLWAVSVGVYVALAMTVPDVEGVMDAEQLDVVALMPVSVHGVPVNEPVAVPVLLKATVPAGALAVPADEVSLTKAVQLVDWATTIVVGEQVTAVVVVRRVTVTVALDPMLPLCAVSVGV
jgi:hypothetical protein